MFLQLLDSQETHPEDYIQFIQPTLDIATQYNFTDVGSGIHYIQFIQPTLDIATQYNFTDPDQVYITYSSYSLP